MSRDRNQRNLPTRKAIPAGVTGRRVIREPAFVFREIPCLSVAGFADHRAWVVRALFVLLAGVTPVLAGYVVYLQWHTPTLDFYLERPGSPVVVQVIAGGAAETAGLQAGDLIVTVDGMAFGRWYNPQLGRTHILGIERAGQRLTLAVPAVPVGQINLLPLLSAMLVAAVFWGTGTLLLWRSFERGDVRILFVLAQLFAVATLLLLAHPSPWAGPSWMRPLTVACFHLSAPLLVHHVSTFPVPLGTPRQRRWRLGLLYALAMVGLAATLASEPLWQRLGVLYTTLEIALAVGILVYVYLRRATPDGRRRLRLIVLGNLLAAVPPMLFYLLPALSGLSYRMPGWLMGVFLVFAPLSYLYAIARHNLFGIDRLLNRAMVYILLSSSIFLLYLIPSLFLYHLLPGDPLIETILITGVTLLVGLSFNWTRTQAQRLVDRFFYGGWYDYAGIVETVSDALARTLSREQLVEVLTRQVPTLMQLYDGQLRMNGPDQSSNLSTAQVPTLQFPLSFQDQVRGLWVVRPHRDGDDFSDADRRILQTLARQAETALGNVLLVETLRRQLNEIRASRETLAQAQRQLLRSREEERARLARDLHDGPIQALVGLNLQLGLLLATGDVGQVANLSGADRSTTCPTPFAEVLQTMRAEVRALLAELRQVCVELRPPMLDTLGLGVALRALAADWSTQSRVAILLDLPPDAALRSLPAEVAMNLYRIVQEALTNTARHAAARQVTIRLTWDDACLTLIVQDDGRGFAVPTIWHDLVTQGHFGLAGIAERVNLIGATWKIESAPGQGTTISITWPTADNRL